MTRPYKRKNVPNRPKRMSIAEARESLNYKDQDPNYCYRVFNDDERKLDFADKIGYEYVEDKDNLSEPSVDGGTQVGSVVSKPVGTGKTGVLMRIKREWFEENQREKIALTRANEKQLDKKTREEGHYGSIQITRK